MREGPHVVLGRCRLVLEQDGAVLLAAARRATGSTETARALVSSVLLTGDGLHLLWAAGDLTITPQERRQ